MTSANHPKMVPLLIVPEYDLSNSSKNGGFCLSYRNMTSANQPKIVVLLIVPEYDLGKSSNNGGFAYSNGI